jgi:hypothetical protein
MVRRLWAIIVDSAVTIGVLAIVLVASIIRCVLATIVEGASMMIIYRSPAIVGTGFHDEFAILDVYLVNILEEGGFHRATSGTQGRNCDWVDKRGKGPNISYFGAVANIHIGQEHRKTI